MSKSYIVTVIAYNEDESMLPIYSKRFDTMGEAAIDYSYHKKLSKCSADCLKPQYLPWDVYFKVFIEEVNSKNKED